jgi:hypothetical protein
MSKIDASAVYRRFMDWAIEQDIDTEFTIELVSAFRELEEYQRRDLLDATIQLAGYPPANFFSEETLRKIESKATTTKDVVAIAQIRDLQGRLADLYDPLKREAIIKAFIAYYGDRLWHENQMMRTHTIEFLDYLEHGIDCPVRYAETYADCTCGLVELMEKSSRVLYGS